MIFLQQTTLFQQQAAEKRVTESKATNRSAS
jgi:hypothetical protein